MRLGLTDIQIIASIVTIFVFTGILLPIIEADFGTDVTTVDVDGVTEGIDEGDLTSLSAWKVIFSIFKMFFWYGGVFPLFLDLIFLVLRIILVLTIARNIWIGGGG